MTAPRVVAIDGAAGSGKSTLARGLARSLDLAYVNTGRMYRALAAAAARSNVSPGDVRRLRELIATLNFTLAGIEPPELQVEGYTDHDLTALEVETTVSTVAKHPAVREPMLTLQRAFGVGGAVMEGRDIGTVVFPDAPVKFYLTADAPIRVARRAGERRGDGAAIAHALRERDDRDAVTNPFEPADGAVVVDTGARGIDETLTTALDAIAERAPWLMPRHDE